MECQVPQSHRVFHQGAYKHGRELATHICGSQDLYDDGRNPFQSINFMTAHNGFRLGDLVSHEAKQSDVEGNRDGEAHHLSLNCGVEGHTSNPVVNVLRERQIR